MLIIAVLLNATANILLKLGAKKFGGFESSGNINLKELILQLLSNYLLIAGLILFALNIVFYFIALGRLNLSVAYPIMMTGGVLIITLFSVFYLKESLTLLQIAGIVLIGFGITFLTSNAT